MPIVANADTIVEGFKQYMRGEGEENIKLLLKTIQSSASNADKISATINALLADNKNNVNETTKNLRLISEEFTKVYSDLKPIITGAKTFEDTLNSLQLKKTLASADESIEKLKELMTSLNNQDGSLGKLLNSDETHNNINTTIRDLDFLVNDMQANPKRYIQFSVVGGTPKDERAIVKNTNDGDITSQIVVNLKREAPNTMVAILFKQDRTSVQVLPKGLGTKTVTIDLPADFTKGSYLCKLDWDVDSEVFNFDVK
jgi:hypothetical protein